LFRTQLQKSGFAHSLGVFFNLFLPVLYFKVSCVSEALHVRVHSSYFVSWLGYWPDKLLIVFGFPTKARDISIFQRQGTGTETHSTSFLLATGNSILG